MAGSSPAMTNAVMSPMPILLAIGGLAFLALLFGPQLWVRRVMARHGAERPA